MRALNRNSTERMLPYEVMQEAMHELSQPITAISLALTVASADVSDREREQTLRIAQEQCTLAMEAVEQIRSLILAEWTRGDSLRAVSRQAPNQQKRFLI